MISQPIWVQTNVVLAVHNRQIAEHGGIFGIRDVKLLESALNKPKNHFSYSEKPDFASMATLYACGIIQNHPFLDGNKRTGLVICQLFLNLNGYKIITSQKDKYLVIAKLAANQITENEFTKWVQKNLSVL